MWQRQQQWLHWMPECIEEWVGAGAGDGYCADNTKYSKLVTRRSFAKIVNTKVNIVYINNNQQIK